MDEAWSCTRRGAACEQMANAFCMPQQAVRGWINCSSNCKTCLALVQGLLGNQCLEQVVCGCADCPSSVSSEYQGQHTTGKAGTTFSGVPALCPISSIRQCCRLPHFALEPWRPFRWLDTVVRSWQTPRSQLGSPCRNQLLCRGARRLIAHALGECTGLSYHPIKCSQLWKLNLLLEMWYWSTCTSTEQRGFQIVPSRRPLSLRVGAFTCKGFGSKDRSSVGIRTFVPRLQALNFKAWPHVRKVLPSQADCSQLLAAAYRTSTIGLLIK